MRNIKLAIDWKEKEQIRAAVRTTIADMLYNQLPEPTYVVNDCDNKALEVYNFIYEHYHDAGTFV